LKSPELPASFDDTVSRIVGESLSRTLGQPIVVENKPGATGTIAAAPVAHAAPDGHTLTMLPGTFAASAAMFRKYPNPVDDFSWIGIIAEFSKNEPRAGRTPPTQSCQADPPSPFAGITVEKTKSGRWASSSVWNEFL
jgi:Tripartite tricarboxylate transporter family receptor